MLKCEREKCPIGFRFSIDLTPVLRSLRHWSNLFLSTLLTIPYYSIYYSSYYYSDYYSLLLLHLLLQLLLPTWFPYITSQRHIQCYYLFVFWLPFLYSIISRASWLSQLFPVITTDLHLILEYPDGSYFYPLSSVCWIVTNFFNWLHLFIYTYRILADFFWYSQDDGLNIVSNRFIWTRLFFSPAWAHIVCYS